MMANHVKTDSVATIGDLLLKGWTMLAESCQDCKVPLMQNPQSGGWLCVNCQSRQERSEEQEGEEDVWDDRLKPFLEAHPVTSGMATSLDIPPEVPATMESRSRADANAEKLAVKMTQGWTLTSIYCPRCHTPLVRSRDSSLFCVACDVKVIPQKQSQSATASPLSSSMRASQKRGQCSPRDDDSRLRDKKKLITLEKSRGTCEAEKPQGEDMELDGISVGRKFVSTELHPKATAGHGDFSTWKLSTRETLMGKIDEATVQLRATPITDPDSCLKMAELISSCCDVLQKLNALPETSL